MGKYILCGGYLKFALIFLLVSVVITGCIGPSVESVELEYTIKVEEKPEEIPDDLQKWKRDEYMWVVVEFEVKEGTLDMQDVWFRSRIETSERFYDLDHTTDKLKNGIQSRGMIKSGGEGIALYQIPVNEDSYSWNLEKMRQDVKAIKKG